MATNLALDDKLLEEAVKVGGKATKKATVTEALEALESWQPDALINDGGAGAPDSYTVVARVRTLDEARGGRIPAAALTVHARRDERLHAMLSAVRRDLPKPVEPAVLTSEIARLTGRERRHSRR